MEKTLRTAGNRSFQIAARIIKIFIVLCFCFVIFYPLLYMLSQASRDFSDLYDPSVVWLPKHFTLDTFKIAFDTMDYVPTALTTGFIAIACTLLQLVSCSLAGYGFARFKFPFKRLLFAVCLFSTIVPMQMIAIPSYMELRYFNMLGIGSIIQLFTGELPGINNTIWAVLLPALLANGIRGSIYIFIFRQFFRGIPLDLEDAAYIDGAGPMSTFVRIIMPNAGAPFLVVFILSLIWYWNDGIYVTLFYTTEHIMSSSLLGILSAFTVTGSQYTITETLAIQQAGAVLMILPPLILFLFLQRFFVESIDKTGLK